MRMFENRIKLLYGKLFGGGIWKVAFKKRDKNGEYTLVEAPEGTWIADPLLFEFDNEHYLFVEVFERNKNKGSIGYYHFINNKPVFQGIVIEQSFHMSYPCIFLWHGNHYMIPESAAGNTLNLYKAEQFPDKWVLEKRLINGEKYVDTTIVEKDGKLYALSYHTVGKKWALSVFLLDMETKELIRLHEKEYSANIGRPAGYVLNDKWLRPAQDCSTLYGESIIWYQIDQIDSDDYREHSVKRTSVTDLRIQGADRVHTYSRDSEYEAVDVRYGKFDLLHGLRSIQRALAGKNESKK